MRISTPALVLLVAVVLGPPARAGDGPPGAMVGGTLVVPLDQPARRGSALFPPPSPVHVGAATIGGPDTTYSIVGGVAFASDGSTVRMIGGTPFAAGRNGPVPCRRIGNAVSCSKDN